MPRIDADLTLAADALSSVKAIVITSTAPYITTVESNTLNDEYGAGHVIDIVVHFSAAVDVTVAGSGPRIQLETGSTDQYATYASGSGGTELVFHYIVQQGDSSSHLAYSSRFALDLNGGAIQASSDAENAVLTLPDPGSQSSLSGQHSIVIDTTEPRILSVFTYLSIL